MQLQSVQFETAWKQDHVKIDPTSGHLTTTHDVAALAFGMDDDYETGGVLATMTKYVTMSGALVSSNLPNFICLSTPHLFATF